MISQNRYCFFGGSYLFPEGVGGMGGGRGVGVVTAIQKGPARSLVWKPNLTSLQKRTINLTQAQAHGIITRTLAASGADIGLEMETVTEVYYREMRRGANSRGGGLGI